MRTFTFRNNMATGNNISDRIFSAEANTSFIELALEVFAFQYHHNDLYKRFCLELGRGPGNVTDLKDIPFLPIECFRRNRIASFAGEGELVFRSSGTTGSRHAKHYVADEKMYLKSFSQGFRYFYGEPSGYCLLALLPGYLERKDSSLVYMVNSLMQQGAHPHSGFYLNDLPALSEKLEMLTQSGQKILLLGVSFALLDFADMFPLPLKNTIVMETGGMKGQRPELIREALHDTLKKAFHLDVIHSEYGMTELLSQAYSKGDGLFSCPPWMRVLIRDANDPLSYTAEGRAGGINVIDLANIHSCSFLATQDLGRMHEGERFEVLGRFDHSDTRGCNLMVV